MGDGPLGDQLLTTVARLQRWATRRAQMPAPPAQVRLLAQLDELAPVRLGELARADHSSQPSMSTQVRRLEVQGWVDRIADDSDGRAVLLQLSRTGRDVLARSRRARVAAVAPLLAALSPHEADTLRTALHALDAALAAAPDLPTTRTKGS